jgi:hypothetical protein
MTNAPDNERAFLDACADYINAATPEEEAAATAEAMAVVRAAVLAERERAAKVAEAHVPEDGGYHFETIRSRIAAAIREEPEP